MLIRYHKDMSRGLYDKAIVAHTHKAGSFSNWYYNCGSWTGSTNNFMKISEDGDIKIFDFTEDRPKINQTVINC